MDLDSREKIPDAVGSLSMSSRTKFWLRIALGAIVALEFGLFALIRTLGWNGTGKTFHLSIACAVVALPMLVIIGTLIWNRFRFGTRSLLVFMFCAALFFWLSAIPYWKYQASRSGTLLLRDARITFSEHASLRFASLTRYLDQPWPEHSVSRDASTAPFWLSPFVKEISRLPGDRMIQEIYLRNDAELQFFLKHHRSFEGLLVLNLTDPSDDSLAKLNEIVPQHPLLTEITCHCSTGKFSPRLWQLIRTHRIPILGVSVPLSSTKPFLPAEMPAWDALRVLSLGTDRNIALGTIPLQEADAEILRTCDRLRLLELYGVRPRSTVDLKVDLPDCEIRVP
jgi:hypothetical protein